MALSDDESLLHGSVDSSSLGSVDEKGLLGGTSDVEEASCESCPFADSDGRVSMSGVANPDVTKHGGAPPELLGVSSCSPPELLGVSSCSGTGCATWGYGEVHIRAWSKCTITPLSAA